MIDVLIIAIRLYTYLILFRVIISWFPTPSNDLLRNLWSAVYALTEPYLGIFRRIIPSVGAGGMGFDLSPILGLLVLFVLGNLLNGAR